MTPRGTAPRHPTVFQPATLALIVILCVLGAIIGMQLLVPLGVTANTSIVGAIIVLWVWHMATRSRA
jgi:uncharacterized membrane protein YeaQ/YmgE (transglycosylase-associated protein family)